MNCGGFIQFAVFGYSVNFRVTKETTPGQEVNSQGPAKETGLEERYISRIIDLAFLALNLTEASLEGKCATGCYRASIICIPIPGELHA